MRPTRLSSLHVNHGEQSLAPSWWGRHAPPPSAEVNSAEPSPTRPRSALLTRELRSPKLFVALVAALAGGLGGSGCFDDSDYQLDQESGATSNRGGSSSSGSGSKAGSTSSSGKGGTSSGGEGPIDPNYPEPTITAMEPTSGPYGTLVTVSGNGLGNAQMNGFTLAIGNQGELQLTPDDEQSVVSWTDQEIVFRYPFPAEGPVAVESPLGGAMVGEFIPSWHVAREVDLAPAASVLASISPEPDHITLLFDTMPLTLIDVGPDATVEHAVSAPGVDPSSLRLYLNTAGVVEGIGVSNDASPVLVHLLNQGGDLVAQATTIQLLASEFAVAGGSEGAAVWMKRAAGWHRARPSGATWKLDKGPIADPDPAAPDRTAGASSDGSLYLAHSEDASFLTDDMEAPYMARLAPTATQFASAKKAGSAVDDYVTGLTLTSSGDGLVVRVCGSDVDPFGFSGTDVYCYDGLHAPSGAQLLGVQVDAKASAHAFTHERAIAAYCTSDRRWFIRSDSDVEIMAGEPVGEQVLFPCPEAVALEVSGQGDYVPVVRWAGKTYLLERNPAL
ncbi:MAG TPA: IPT/TIG domain-containing protein [Polyangiaceae bacterium]|nr:IPT/TIG domain-containing protein [Polyangiaceae bacterium]